MFFGWALLGERLALLDLVGILPVALGIYLVTHPGKSLPSRAAGTRS
jgi:drug/metabolite transporter (DMT)-like permease